MKLKYQLAIAGVSVLFVLGILLARQQRSPKLLREFFNEESHPLNLSVFRIVFFTALACSFSISNTIWFSSLPVELRFPPPGWQWLLGWLPVNPTGAWIASLLMLIFCITGALGLFTRASALCCLVLGLYVLGIPQFYGKINHYHHLLWFTTILAFSPCADVLSIDALLLARRRADNGITDPPSPSRNYALPIRFIWLTMGAIYFSAGFWKVWTGGYRWAFSDNPRNMMYNKWMEFDGWLPFFRIDQHPLLYQLSAAATIVFELTFIVLIFFPTLRLLAALGGLAFHNSTRLFMRISFWQMQICYVSFVNWHRLFALIGSKLFRGELFLIYDGNCRICRRTVASLRTFDILGRVTYVNAFDKATLERDSLSRLNDEDLLKDIHVVQSGRSWRGFAAYQALARRFPLLWPLLFCTYVPPLAWVGNVIYRRVADKRVCEIAQAKDLHRAGLSAAQSVRALTAVSVLLLYLAIVTAVGKINSWPFAGYPTFEDLDKPEVTLVTMEVETLKGTRGVNLFVDDGNQQMTPDRMMAMLGRILAVESEPERRARLQALWNSWSRERGELQDARVVRFYRDTVSSLPERHSDNLIQRQFLYELRLSN